MRLVNLFLVNTFGKEIITMIHKFRTFFMLKECQKVIFGPRLVPMDGSGRRSLHGLGLGLCFVMVLYLSKKIRF